MSSCDQCFTCINCGSEVKALFKQYSPTVLKLVNCNACSDVADKYIEYDPVIVIIDLILLRKEAYRHILYNTEFKSHWKLAVMLQMMEVYSEWIFMSHKLDSEQNTSSLRDMHFCLLNIKVFLRTLSSVGVVLLLTLLYSEIFKEIKGRNFKLVWKAMVLSNFGWFLLLPSLIWDNSLQEIHFTFISLYTTLSQLLAYTLVCNCPKIWSICVIVLSYNCKIVSNEMYDSMYQEFVHKYDYLLTI